MGSKTSHTIILEIHVTFCMVSTISPVLKKEQTEDPEPDATTEANEGNESEDEEKTLNEIIEMYSK